MYKRQVRTYYPRAYEVTYLLGLLAGALTRTDRVGYVAPHPVYGVPAVSYTHLVTSRKTLDKSCNLTPKLFFQAAAQLGEIGRAHV